MWADAEYQLATRQSPNPAPSYLNLGYVQLSRSRNAEVCAAFARYLELRPADANGRWGRVVRLPPPVVSTHHLERLGGTLPFAPAYGEHTDAILREGGVVPADLAALRAHGVVA